MNGSARSGWTAGVVALAVLLVVLVPATARGQSPAPESRLLNVEKQLEKSQHEHEQLQREVQTLADDLAGVRQGLVKAASAVQEHEENLTQLETRLSGLETRRDALRNGLLRRSDQSIRVLMALERLAWRPTEALIAQPLSPAATVRSAILLRAAVPRIQASAEEMRVQLAALATLRGEISSQRDRIGIVTERMASEHGRLKDLFQRKAGLQQDAEERSRDVARRLRELSREAGDLRELMAKLEEERRHRLEEERAATEKARIARERIAEERRLVEEKRLAEEKLRLAEEQRRRDEVRRVEEEARRRDEERALAMARDEAEARRLEAEQKRAAEARRLEDAREAERRAEQARKAEEDHKAGEAARKAEETAAAHEASLAASGAKGKTAGRSAKPFSEARGRLPLPARGRIITAYGQVNDVGLSSKGITIRTRSMAQVIAPYDGVVVFSGPFRGYGQLLIIEHGEGYHTLLAGMTRIDAEVGQRLLAGEPVGVIEDQGEPTLYVELRREGQPINPLPWLAAQKGNNRG